VATGSNEICSGRQLCTICEGFPLFRLLTPSPSSCCVGLLEPELMTKYSALRCVYLRLARHKVGCDPAGCGEHFIKPITASHVQPNVEPASMFKFKFSACS
jgi:hypothetical protein